MLWRWLLRRSLELEPCTSKLSALQNGLGTDAGLKRMALDLFWPFWAITVFDHGLQIRKAAAFCGSIGPGKETG
jgi:hypothetical protein